MISVIICSRKRVPPAVLLENIKATIGSAYELIVVDNSENRYSIFEAYNIGVSKSKYPYLCFMHDDILFYSQNWGMEVIRHFGDEATGAIGIAGTPYYPKMPGSWWGGGLVNETLMQNIDGKLTCSRKTIGDRQSGKYPAVALDGVWLCIRKSLFGEIRFDELNFQGFHFYDIDICLQIHNKGYKLYSLSDVLIQHFYTGKVDRQWIDNAMTLQKKWKHRLPADVTQLSSRKRAITEYKTLGEYIRILLTNNVPRTKVYLKAAGLLIRFYQGYPYLPGLVFSRLKKL